MLLAVRIYLPAERFQIGLPPFQGTQVRLLIEQRADQNDGQKRDGKEQNETQQPALAHVVNKIRQLASPHRQSMRADTAL